jgi:DNA-binding transcriptional regulator YdaS (Cro superfamily)
VTRINQRGANNMDVNDALKLFKTQSSLAATLGVTQPCVSNWVRRGGVIPALQQLRLQKLSKGRLKADESILSNVSRS